MLYRSTDSLEIIKHFKKGSLILHVKGAEYSYSFFSYFLELVSMQAIVVKYSSFQEFNDNNIYQKSITDTTLPTLLFLGCIESAEQYKHVKKRLTTSKNENICFFYDKQTFSLKNNYAELHFEDISTPFALHKLWNSFNALLSISDKTMYYFSNLLIDRYTRLSVEQACSLLKYIPIIQHYSEQEALNVIGFLFEINYSLFELSALFFSKQPMLFFKRWLEIHSLYPPIFWLGYWSDQLFRAYCYLQARKNYNTAPKHLGAKLPFSFINKDYSRTNIATLIKVHTLLVNQDHRLKQGYTADIALLLHTWFLD